MIFCKITLISTHLIKGTILGRMLWVLIPSPHVIDPRILNLVHRHFIFDFSMVFRNKLWW